MNIYSHSSADRKTVQTSKERYLTKAVFCVQGPVLSLLLWRWIVAMRIWQRLESVQKDQI